MAFMRTSPRERLKQFYAQFTSEDHVLIPINADPDAIASAMAVKRLLWRKTASVTITNVNEIKRPDNLAMIRLVGANLVPFAQVDLSRYSCLVMVDSQPDHHESLCELAPRIIIDHHPIGTPNKAHYEDIRPNYGATASILIEYLRAAKIKPSSKLATSLYLAIKTDTSNFERKTQMEDLKAFQYVFRFTNTALAHRIEQAEMRIDFLPYFKRAIQSRRIRKGRATVHLGQVIHPDVCVLIADFFLRVDSINWSIVSGLHQRKLVIIFRNDGIRNNAGKVAKQSFGALGSAGGHKSAARAEVPLENIKEMVDHRDDAKMIRWIVQRIKTQA
jgi:nanoRNase/pAp phosphatase (c-di-AMP/oligoRNAs hydrolase)